MTPEATADAVLDVDQAAARLGTDRSYVKRLLLATERHAIDPELHRRPLQPLHGRRDEAGRWTVTLEELERFAAARREPKVVVAYDATFKWEKSISAAWVQADPTTRRIIEDALDVGVRTGIAYLENHALEVRHGDRRLAADGMWAVQYRHTTNRNLEPQLHDHVVIANIAADPNGTTKTIAARSLFRHATTAGHLAGQAVRHHLTEHLGYEWGTLRNGTCDLAHIHPTPLGAISTRSRDVRELADTYGIDSQKARRIAALATRRRKDEPTDYAALEASWSETLSHWGSAPTTSERCTTERRSRRSPMRMRGTCLPTWRVRTASPSERPCSTVATSSGPSSPGTASTAAQPDCPPVTSRTTPTAGSPRRPWSA